MPSRRTLLGLLVVLFWAGALTLLWRQQTPSRWPPGGEAPPERRDLRLAILLGDDTRVGTLRLRSEPERRRDRDGERFDLDARLTLRLLGEATDLSIEGTSWRASEPSALEIDLRVASAGQILEVRAETRDGRLVGEIVSAGETTPLDVDLGDARLLEAGLGTAVRFPTLEPGDSVRVTTFDPITLAPGSARVRCVGAGVRRIGDEEVEVRELEVETGGLVLRAWTDRDGVVVRAETPFGFVLERLPTGDEGAGTEGPSAAPTDRPAAPIGVDGEDLLALTAVRPAGERPRRGATSLVLSIRGAPVDLPVDATQQRLGGGRFRIRPIGPSDPEPSTPEPPRPEDLAAAPLVQSDHPRIRELAEEIVAGARSPAERAGRIGDWVFAEIAKEPAMSVPSALAVLEARRGDCNEHTVLYTALARAAGLPTRIAIGLVWSETWDGFYYHAWPRVFLGDRWIWTDPTLGQPIADATHLQLLEGGIEQWPRLLRWLGKIEIEVEEVAPPPPS